MKSLLGLDDFVVRHRPKLFEVRVGYDVYDVAGTPLASIVQVGRDNVERTFHPRREDAANTALELRDLSEVALLSLMHTQAFKSSVAVARPGGDEIGCIRLEKILGKSRFILEAGDAKVGAMAAQTWRGKNYVAVDAGGDEIARVDMTKGTSADMSHDNHYAVHVSQPLDDPLRSLAFAAVIAVDMILWHR